MTEDADEPTVVLSDRQDLPADHEALRDVARRTLVAERRGDAELSVSLVTAEEMAALHAKYAGDPEPTDVLSFPMDADGPLLGDVVICPAVAAEANADTEAELRLLVVHGVLHLLGYDHETDEDRTRMWQRQEAYSGVSG